MKIGQKILQLIKAKGLKKVEIVAKMDISRTTLENWILGKTTPDHADLVKLSKIMHIDISELAMGKTTQSDGNEITKIPFYDAVAMGGLSILADQSPVDQPSDMIDPGTFLRSATGSLRVYGDSMFPKYPGGCIVAFKPSISAVIIWGEDYVIELSDRRIVKRIEKSELKDHVKAVSYNINKDNKYVYDPIDIPRSEIKRLFIVLGRVVLEASI